MYECLDKSYACCQDISKNPFAAISKVIQVLSLYKMGILIPLAQILL